MTELSHGLDPFRPMISDFGRWLAISTLVCACATLIAVVACGRPSPRWKRARNLVIGVAGVCVLVTVRQRWGDVGHFPGQSRAEVFLLLGLASLVTAIATRGQGVACAAANGLALASLVYAGTLDSGASNLPPALQSGWFVVHVGGVVLGYAVILVAAAGALADAVRRRRADTRDLERMSWPAYRVGFVLLTIGIASGAVWSWEAWGTPWTWDAKQCAATVTWLLLLGAGLVAETDARAWRRPLLVLGAASILVSLFAYGTLPAAQKSLHRFTDLGITP